MAHEHLEYLLMIFGKQEVIEEFKTLRRYDTQETDTKMLLIC